MWRTSANQLLGVLAWFVWHCSNRNNAQLAAWRVIRLSHSLLALIYRRGVSARLRKDWRGSMLNRMLSVFTRIGSDFQLHVDMHGVHHLMAAHEEHGGVLVCTGHFGLTLASHKALFDLGLTPIYVGSGEGGARNTSGWNWGTSRAVVLLDSDRPDIFLQAKRRLDAGAVIIAYVDYDPEQGRPGADGPMAISPNAFIWAALHHIPILFMAARPDEDGRIVLEFIDPVHRLPHDPRTGLHCAAEFRDFMASRMDRDYVILRPKNAAPAL
jgi:hypothetical protein